MSRYAARKDANHGTIVAVFEQLDCSVLDVSMAPCGFDVIVGYKSQAIAVEIKDGDKPESARKLTPNEHSAHLNWRGPKAIIKNNDEAVTLVKVMRLRHFAVMNDEFCDWLGS